MALLLTTVWKEHLPSGIVNFIYVTLQLQALPENSGTIFTIDYSNQTIYNKMKKVSLLLVMATTLLFTNSFAQVTQKGGTSTDKPATTAEKPSSDKKDKVQSEMSGDAASTAKEWTMKMDEICNLDQAQEKKVMEINLRYANKLEELKAKYKGMENPNADAAKAEKDELTKARFKEYSNVLSKEQMQKFKEYRNSKKDENKGDSAGKSEKKDDMKEKYKNATPEEKEKMKEEMKDKKDKKQNKE
ncbi:MAG TPA: hypothetical protein PLJ43_03395 [Chitinophagales bacterium]|nr:hypothetical protein [Chitinophagales bacterium]